MITNTRMIQSNAHNTMKYIISFAFLLILLLGTSDIADALLSDQYVFGSEVGGWVYNSLTNFLIFSIALVVIGGTGLILTLRSLKNKTRNESSEN